MEIISRNVHPIFISNCDWFLGRLREVGFFENVALDSLKTIICLDHGLSFLLSFTQRYIKHTCIWDRFREKGPSACLTFKSL